MSHSSVSIFWFRRDFRLDDNAGLYHALKESKNVLPLFIFDTDILSKLSDKQDARVEFIHQQIERLENELQQLGSSILVKQGTPLAVFEQVCKQYPVSEVYCNHDYEPNAINRDQQINSFLISKGIACKTFKDQVIFEKAEVVKDDQKPYTVFTPFMRKWKAKLNPFYLKSYPTLKYSAHFLQTNPFPKLSLRDIGFEPSNITFPVNEFNESIVKNYTEQRNFPAVNGTSRLSVHLRFGTVSIRQLVQKALVTNETWLNELIWREFYMVILYHFPKVVHQSFKPQYDAITWSNNEEHFERWCAGKTGYPIVDAGMRELNQTGFMHNRVRMIVASFLTKHLLIDWRWGEAYFAQKLLDFELASNNGGWQWSASSGCDAVPYFRIFNPYEQTKRFDQHLKYIKKWIPEFDELHYIKPIVEHKFARERVLAVYKKALQGAAE